MQSPVRIEFQGMNRIDPVHDKTLGYVTELESRFGPVAAGHVVVKGPGEPSHWRTIRDQRRWRYPITRRSISTVRHEPTSAMATLILLSTMRSKTRPAPASGSNAQVAEAGQSACGAAHGK